MNVARERGVKADVIADIWPNLNVLFGGGVFAAPYRRIIESTEDVGDRFAEEARRIHYSEAPERAIRGSTSREEAVALREEGIEVLALPMPVALKGSLQ